ncbi:MAG: Lrp/AsnC family transcriptional regulator [Aquificae bacterium]|nr:Lrp/AsnC family transcriptional regulator [Aquificota bacterium]
MLEALTDTEKQLLKKLQEGIPLVKRPFKEIGNQLGITEEETINLIKKLKEGKIIRQISPIYDTKSLGYDSSLVAFKVEGDMDKVAQVVNSHPGVSHNYQRTDEFNLWFTIAVPPDSQLGLGETVKLLAEKTGVKDYAVLKTVKLYKIGVKLDFGSVDEKETGDKQEKKLDYTLTEQDKHIVKITQQDIPLTGEPFKEYAKDIGIDEDSLIQKLKLYKDSGIMRRFAAILFHRKAGFKANGMTVWKVPEDKVDDVGYTLASYRSVSHCYKRTTNEKWQYNLFSMIHAKTKEELEDFVKKLSDEIGIKDYKILYSTKEYKKKRVKYFSDEFYRWEREILQEVYQ